MKMKFNGNNIDLILKEDETMVLSFYESLEPTLHIGLFNYYNSVSGYKDVDIDTNEFFQILTKALIKYINDNNLVEK